MDLMHHEKWRDTVVPNEIVRTCGQLGNSTVSPMRISSFLVLSGACVLSLDTSGGEGEAWCQEPFGSTWQIVYTSLY